MSHGKTGRPKKQQTRPLIFERTHGRVERTINMSPKTAADLDRYVGWAAAQVGAKVEEALTLTADQAFALWFQRDQLFQESLEDRTESGREAAAKPPVAGGPPAAAAKPSLPASLPPPRAGSAS